MKRLVSALALVLLTSGCAYQHSGHPFDSAAVAQLQPGVSTERDVTDKLGPPSATLAPYAAFNYPGGQSSCIGFTSTAFQLGSAVKHAQRSCSMPMAK